jgi:hypothetical protein
MSRVRKVFAVLCSSVMLAAMAASPAAAQNNSNNHGLVNVSVGNVEILNDANIGAAVQAAADVCPNVNVGTIAVLAQAASRTGNQQTVCTSNNEPVTISQA